VTSETPPVPSAAQHDGAAHTAAHTVVLTGNDLTVDQVVAVARHRATVSVSPDALRQVVLAREVVERVLARDEPVYGLNTGLGSFAQYRISQDQMRRFSFSVVADQTLSYGRLLSTEVVRAMMLTRANGMAKAGVGVRRELVLLLVEALNRGVHPLVRELGSVGESDLAEMAEIGKVLIGVGRAEWHGTVLPGAEALAKAGLAPIELAPKEALALISANGLTLGRGALVLNDAADLADALQIAAALSLEGFAGNLSVIHPGSARLSPQIGPNTAAARLRQLLDGSYLWHPNAARNLQDPLSFRCAPRIHGAFYDALAYVRGEMESELNAANDNPAVLIEEELIVSGGNFDMSALAMAFDLVRLAIANSVKVANERVQKLLWREFSGLPSALATEEGVTNGLKQIGRTCASIAAEARSLANPVSLDYVGQLAEGVEDYASMAPSSVRKTSELVALTHAMVMYELIVAGQAIQVGQRGPLGQGTEAALRVLRRHVPVLTDETRWAPDLEGFMELIANGRLSELVARRAGERQPLSEARPPGVLADAEVREIERSEDPTEAAETAGRPLPDRV
jgi:histidine ammonia-lyase